MHKVYQEIKLLEKTEKQAFLRKHISNLEVNQIKFAEYLSEKKENGADIENWNLEELENQVILFNRKINSKLTREEKL